MELLSDVNSKLWETEDLIRSSKDTVEWVSRAQRVIQLNDLRASIKKSIDLMFKDEYDPKTYSGEKSYNI